MFEDMITNNVTATDDLRAELVKLCTDIDNLRHDLANDEAPYITEDYTHQVLVMRTKISNLRRNLHRGPREHYVAVPASSIHQVQVKQ